MRGLLSELGDALRTATPSVADDLTRRPGTSRARGSRVVPLANTVVGDQLVVATSRPFTTR